MASLQVSRASQRNPLNPALFDRAKRSGITRTVHGRERSEIGPHVFRERVALDRQIFIGRQLLDIRAKLPKGEFKRWLAESGGISPSKAKRFMKAAQEAEKQIDEREAARDHQPELVAVDGHHRGIEMCFRISCRLVVLALWFSPAFASADTLADLKQCKDLEDYAVRLDCYDTAMERASRPVGAGNEISLKDLQLDYKKFRGKRVTTTGTFMMMGEQGLLYDTTMGMTAFFVDIDKLPREDRSVILDNCATGCPMKVTGKVADVIMQKGKIATHVELE